jgi:hypothetical protein
MINYELAKELERAGFPLPKMKDKEIKNREFIEKEGIFIRKPNLQELIEECGECIKTIRQIKDSRSGKTIWAIKGRINGKTLQIIRSNNLDVGLSKLWLKKIKIINHK